MKDPMTLVSMPPILTYKVNPSAPTLKLPSLACDSHVHVFGPAARFPFAENRNFTPVDAPKETLFALHKRLGIGRCVIVQSVTHGFDNRVVEDAMAAGEGRYLGVALAPANVADAELQRLAAAGFRAVRFNFMTHLAGSSGMDEVLALTPRLKAVGMHLQVHFESGLMHRLAPALSRSAVPVVIDHMGRVDAALGTDQPDFVALQALLNNPLFYVKVSGIDRIDPHPVGEGAQPYAKGVALARLLVQSYPDRCVWGTDWPHPNHTHVPDDGVLVDALARIAPTPSLLDKLLVQNPQSLYRFRA
ncbi:amidohydrolase family protein [Rhodoferax ferrireducens]|uniref:amidohydrolase family protein n=1 Tax=Rhodoferax ferrireducens TaxID=192843 RepID=UPI001E432CDF|nr:amidohydrolase family protein [Rhodoferax ferrireducens]